MLVSRKRTSSLPPPILYVSGTPLQRVTSVRYLGVELTQDLSWSLHVSHLCAKARQFIGLLYRRFYKHANTATLLNHLSDHIWNTVQLSGIHTSPRTCIEALEKVQRFALRMCLKNWSFDHTESVVFTVDDTSPYSETI